jgi:hypothetical protein
MPSPITPKLTGSFDTLFSLFKKDQVPGQKACVAPDKKGYPSLGRL